MPDQPPLSPESWDRLADAFDGALALPASERAAYLDRALPGDDAARHEVEMMLAAHADDRALRVERRLADAQEQAVSPHLTAGTRLGSYRIDSLIGEGGMGEVYRADRVDGQYQQTVAIKVLRAGVRSAEYARRFQIERQILARLTHPDIVSILDGGTTEDGRPYLVMPYVEGLPLNAHCEQHGLSIPDRLRLFRRVADAVQFAHGRLVVHRDLKPSNILVTRDGEPRLLDFGIAKVLRDADDAEDASATRSALRLLTPDHAAPEQIRGDPATTATDVYSLGVLLYQLLAGRRPFLAEGRSLLQLERDILEEPPSPPSAVTADPARARRLRGDLDRIVLMALRKEPDRRYVSAGQLAEDVERHLGGLPVRAQKDTLEYRTRKFVSRNRGAVAAASGFFLLLAAFAITAAVQARRVARERDRAEQQKQSADEVVSLLTGLFERSNPVLHAGGDTLRVASLIEDGERRVDSLTTQPQLQARMWRVLGNMHAARGNLARAVELLRRSYDKRVSLGDTGTIDAATTYLELARAVQERDGEDKARPMFEVSLARFERLVGPERLEVAQALQELAAVTKDRALARQRLERAVRIRAQHPEVDAITQAATLNALATMDFGDGRYRDAASSFGAALRILSEKLPAGDAARLTVTQNYAAILSTLGDYARAESLRVALLAAVDARHDLDSTSYVSALENLALTRVQLGDLESGERMLRAALGVRRRSQAANHPAIMNTLRNVAVTVGLRGRPAEGIPLLDTAIAISVARDSVPSVGTAYLRGQRALLLLQLGRVDEAMSILRQSEEVIRRRLEPDAPYVADLDGWLGVLALERGRPDSAELHFRRVHDVLVKSIPADHPQVLGADCGAGVALVEGGRVKEAEPLLRPACETYARWGTANRTLVARARRALSGTEAVSGSRR